MTTKCIGIAYNPTHAVWDEAGLRHAVRSGLFKNHLQDVLYRSEVNDIPNFPTSPWSQVDAYTIDIVRIRATYYAFEAGDEQCGLPSTRALGLNMRRVTYLGKECKDVPRNPRRTW